MNLYHELDFQEVSLHIFGALARITFEVLYMSFDKFLLAVESRNLSQADKGIIKVSSFPKAVFE